MGLEQQVWSLSDGKRLREVKAPSEKQIEDLLAANIEILDAGWLVIGRQVKTEGGGFIDILCIDQQGALVVVELKRELTPREVTAQALDYASCVSVFTEAQIAETYMAYSRKLGRLETLDKAYERKFGMKLDADAFRGDAGRNEVKIVVVATRMDGSTERIIEYLSEAFKVNINILFFCVLEYNGSLLLSRAWLREREELTAAPAVGRREWNGEYFFNFGDSESRSWEEARKYGSSAVAVGNGTTKSFPLLSRARGSGFAFRAPATSVSAPSARRLSRPRRRFSPLMGRTFPSSSSRSKAIIIGTEPTMMSRNLL